MIIYHIVLLAAVQGITEFLPISSSGHLILISEFLELPDQGLELDVAVHIGTLFAVMIYFWRDIIGLSLGFLHLLSGRSNNGTQLVVRLTIATLPILGAGFLFSQYIPHGLRSIELIAWTTTGFAIMLWIVDRLGMTVCRIEHLGKHNALFIGIFQILSLLPGTSRAGITITAGRILGMERSEAARFSILLSVPTIIGAGALSAMNLYQMEDIEIQRSAILAVALSFVVGISSIAIMMQWLKTSTFTPFVIYRIALGVGLLFYVYY